MLNTSPSANLKSLPIPLFDRHDKTVIACQEQKAVGKTSKMFSKITRQSSSSTSGGGSGGGVRIRTSQRPRRTVVVGGKAAALAAIALGACCVDVAHGFSSSIACPLDALSCIGDDECAFCLNLLRDAGLSPANLEFEECGELYAGMCLTVESYGCNVENEDLVDLLACTIEEEYGCGDFTTCADATAGLAAATEAPASAPSAAPAAAATPAPSAAATTAVPVAAATAAAATASPVAATVAPAAIATTAAPGAPTFATPVFPLPTAAPTPGSRGGIFSPPTAAPTAAGSEATDTAFPSPAVFESSTDTMAPSESSAAPTGVDGLRGEIGGAFSGAPTAAPTGSEGLDGANGGASSSGQAAAWCVGFATVLAGLGSALVGASAA